MQPSRAPLNTAILALIAIVFVFEWLTGALFDDAKLIQMGAILPGIYTRGDYWRLLAGMFLHAGFVHWLANSWALYQLGSVYEELFGSRRYLATYFATGLIASSASSIAAHGPAVGASGAIFGILGALIFSIKRSPVWRHAPWAKSLLSQLVFWVLVNLALGFSVKNIDNVAHITGLLAGLAIGLVPHRVPPVSPGSAVIDVTPSGESPSDPADRTDAR